MMLLEHPIPGHITLLYVFSVVNLVILLHVTLVGADVRVNNPRNKTIELFYDMPADFGAQLTDEGVTGNLLVANPPNACNEVQPPPFNLTGYKWILMIRRGDCEFAWKVLLAQNAGYNAVIVRNNESDYLEHMNGGEIGHRVKIPSVFIGEADGLYISSNFKYHKGEAFKYTITIDGRVPFNINTYLIPFAVVVGCCFVLMVVFMVGKWCLDMKKKRKSRLSKKTLNKLPIHKFKKGDKYEVCAICLDEYEEGEKLRVLPCSHAYHYKCIDPWLTKNKRVCPICKQRVFPGENDADSDSEAEEQRPSERTPLLGSTTSNTSSNPRRSTFEDSGLPSLDDVMSSGGHGGHVNIAAVYDEDEGCRDDTDDTSSDISVEGAVGGVAVIEISSEVNDETTNTKHRYYEPPSNSGSINSCDDDEVAITPVGSPEDVAITPDVMATPDTVVTMPDAVGRDDIEKKNMVV